MQIVIEIDENAYTKLFDNGLERYPYPYDALAWAARHGIVLPKGHGRLIDVSELFDDINRAFELLGIEKENNLFPKVITPLDVVMPLIVSAKTVIPADKEESE